MPQIDNTYEMPLKKIDDDQLNTIKANVIRRSKMISYSPQKELILPQKQCSTENTKKITKPPLLLLPRTTKNSQNSK